MKELRKFANDIPFNRRLGIRVTRFHKDGVTVEWGVKPELTNASGVAHGGVAATLADAAVGISLSWLRRKPAAATTIELKINYFKPVAAGNLRARARILRLGKTIACGSVEIRDDRRQIVCAALVTYMLL